MSAPGEELIDSVSNECSASVIDTEDPKQVWDTLKAHFTAVSVMIPMQSSHTCATHTRSTDVAPQAAPPVITGAAPHLCCAYSLSLSRIGHRSLHDSFFGCSRLLFGTVSAYPNGIW